MQCHFLMKELGVTNWCTSRFQEFLKLIARFHCVFKITLAEICTLIILWTLYSIKNNATFLLQEYAINIYIPTYIESMELKNVSVYYIYKVPYNQCY